MGNLFPPYRKGKNAQEESEQGSVEQTNADADRLVDLISRIEEIAGPKTTANAAEGNLEATSSVDSSVDNLGVSTQDSSLSQSSASQGMVSQGATAVAPPPTTASSPLPANAAAAGPESSLPEGSLLLEDSPLQGAWYPTEPRNWDKIGLGESEIEGLLLKVLYLRSEATGRTIAEHIKLPFGMISPLLEQLKLDQLVAHRGSAVMNDYVYQLTGVGRERAKRLWDDCTYCGAAPVPFKAYLESVKKQTIADQRPTATDLKHAFRDLLVSPQMLKRLGPAVNSGRGLFLYGAPGNGKTSIAERVTRAFGQYIWIPRAIAIDGEVMRLYDPSLHEEAPIEASGGLLDERLIDHRWVRILRPTVVVGGELTMDALEVTLNTATNVSEAPIQLKSNCGTLVIDDFGRQRMTTDELLNRWIVPLEKRYDFLNLSSGKKLQVPFDQLIIFSTNLEPKDLVDDAFLRRIPYKIEVEDPDEESFRKLLGIMGKLLKIKHSDDAIEYLIETHYKQVSRPFRCCQPRDLLLQVRNYCRYIDQEPVMSKDNFDFAVENYFAVM